MFLISSFFDGTCKEKNIEIVAGNCFALLHSLHGGGNLLRESYSGGKITEATLHPEMFVFPILAVLT